MKKSHWIVGFLMLGQAMLVGCIEPFNPPEVEEVPKYLVVSGFFNTGNVESAITLSRTVPLEGSDGFIPETGASVIVERERGGHYEFSENPRELGTYTYPAQFIGQEENFRLRITTQNGKVYLSDYTAAKVSPPIDSIGYELLHNGENVQLTINTQDLSGKTRFYQWELEETWEYTAAFWANYQIAGRKIIPRTDSIYRCWKTNRERKIVIGTTIKFQQDVLRNAGIAVMPVSSNRFLIKYSASVKQYALTQEAYEYWTALSKSTENTGSIFDPVPMLVTGNIRCQTDPKEKVFGFFSAGALAEKRVFLQPRLGSYPLCYQKEYTLSEQELIDSGYAVIDKAENGFNYIVADEWCVDCRLEGGTTTRPAFWNN
jgi:hypothetical protein